MLLQYTTDNTVYMDNISTKNDKQNWY